MEELKKNLIELKSLLENQNSSIAIFIGKMIDKLNDNDFSCIDEIMNAAKIQDFMNNKAAYLFNKILDIAYEWKLNKDDDIS